MIRKLAKQFHFSEKGFTLIELLVVIAILGALTAIAIPNVGKFMSKGRSESYGAELHNIQTAVITMLADSAASQLDQAYPTPTGDMSTVCADNGTLTLDDYLAGLNGSMVRSDCTYTFSQDGEVVTQITPP